MKSLNRVQTNFYSFARVRKYTKCCWDWLNEFILKRTLSCAGDFVAKAVPGIYFKERRSKTSVHIMNLDATEQFAAMFLIIIGRLKASLVIKCSWNVILISALRSHSVRIVYSALRDCERVHLAVFTEPNSISVYVVWHGNVAAIQIYC